MRTNRLRKRKTATKRTIAIVVLVLVAIGAIVGGWFIWQSFFGEAAKKLPKAELTLNPATGNFDVDQEFDVDILIDTKGGKVPNAAAYLEFNKDIFEVVKVQPNTEDAEASDPIFEKSWGPKDQKAIKAVNKKKTALDNKGWIVIAGMTGRMTDGGAEKDKISGDDAATPTPGSEEQWFEGQDKLATITFKGKKDATSKVNFHEFKSAVMLTREEAGIDDIGQPKEDPVDILAVVKGGNYTIGDGGVETPAPYDLTAVGGNQKVDLAWNWKWDADLAVKDQNTTYNLYRAEILHTLGTDSSGVAVFTKIKSGLTDKNYTDTDVENGHTYEYYTTAVVDSKESDPSNHAIATPNEREIPAPTNLVAIAGDNRVGLTWDYVSATANTKFRVYRALKDELAPDIVGRYEQIAEVVDTNYTDTDVVNGTTYLYYVTAVVGGQESGPSNIVEATPNAGGGILHADIAYNDGEGNAIYGRDNKVDYFDYAFLMNVVWGQDPSDWPDPNVDFAKFDSQGNVILGSDGNVDYAEYAYMLNVEWGIDLTSPEKSK